MNINLINKLNYISENEESIEMPGSYAQFNIRYYSDDWFEFNVGDTLLYECFGEEQYNDLSIMSESLETIKEQIEILECAKSVLEFAVHEEKQIPEGKK